MPERNRYEVLILTIFRNHYQKGNSEFLFDRSEMETVAADLGIRLPKNLGDLIYSFRYRRDLPKEILATEKGGREWMIEPAGRSKYRFKLTRAVRIVANPGLAAIKIPDATPEIVAAWALNDEQALLAKVRYNRLVDLFLGIVAYSLQNHLRTTVRDMGQIELDELYVGVSRSGQQFAVPVQAKAGADRLGAIQTLQDIACCAEKFPRLTCRPVSAQFLADDVIAMFELTVQDGEVRIQEEKHYLLVPADRIGADDLKTYSSR
jgi:hypothetical protein